MRHFKNVFFVGTSRLLCLQENVNKYKKQAMKPLPENASMMFSNKYFF